jgi:hypothetical protein
MCINHFITAYFFLKCLIATEFKSNILLIVSVYNSDHLGCCGESRVYTPALDSLAKSGARYTSSYAPTAFVFLRVQHF